MPSLSGIVPPPQSWPVSVYVLIALALYLAFGDIVSRPSFPKTAPKVHRGLPVFGSLDFFRSRGDFLRSGKLQSETGQFSFYYGPHPVVAVSGSGGKTTFYGDRGLDFNEGFKHLVAAVPNVKFLNQGNLIPFFLSSVRRFLQKDRLRPIVPIMVGDTHAALITMASAPNGIVRPFDEMWRLVYQLTHRTMGTNDIANNPKEMDRTIAIYASMEGSYAIDVMFPSFPTFKKVNKLVAGAKLYKTLSRIVEDRKKTGRREEDAMQAMMDQGEDARKISAVIIGALFAGVINSGINAAWVLCFLAQNRTWYARTQEEVDAVITKHRGDRDEQPVDTLKRLTLEEWETEFPLIDLGLRETIRLSAASVSMRKNVSGKDIPIGETGEVIPKDMFAVYMQDNTHLDENTYKDAQKWDPERYLPDRAEDQKSPNAYLGWGTGLHQCLGMKFAKLEIYITTSMFMAQFDFRLCDESGRPIDALPEINRNNLGSAKPEEQVYFKITPRVN
ncbi:cytochrome P450 6A1 [Dactylonectria estremocensis]|uniref:Cytochrome P450 6A1 n=1 Tax=Dactylonectria estremocensis TaxID=1079267 RepID=A0A9P9IZ99_9HYPO|nr:cytochrome P450 6A1 [Dactylonectria estremocensis]